MWPRARTQQFIKQQNSPSRLRRNSYPRCLARPRFTNTTSPHGVMAGGLFRYSTDPLSFRITAKRYLSTDFPLPIPEFFDSPPRPWVHAEPTLSNSFSSLWRASANSGSTPTRIPRWATPYLSDFTCEARVRRPGVAKTPWSPALYRPRNCRLSARTHLHSKRMMVFFSVRSWWTRRLDSTHILTCL